MATQVDPIEFTMPGVVDQQVVFGRQSGSKLVECRQYLVPCGINQKPRLEPVPHLQQLVQLAGVVDG